MRRHARRRRRLKAGSTSDGHSTTQMTTLTGNEPQAPMYSATPSPPQPVIMMSMQTAA